MDLDQLDHNALSSSSSSSSSSASSSCKPCSPNSESSSVDQVLTLVSHKRKAGRKKFKETRHPVFRGVRQREGNKWVCEVREPYKKSRIWLGTFPSPEMAARAYDVAALALRGKYAALNFPDSASVLPRAKSSSAKDIQRAAFAAAEAFRPTAPCCNSLPSLDISSHSTNISRNTEPVCSSSQISNDHEKDQGKVLKPSCLEEMQPNDQSLETIYSKPNDEYNPLFVDEEAIFNMPRLLESMAEGLLLNPPALILHGDVDCIDDDTGFTMNLWD